MNLRLRHNTLLAQPAWAWVAVLLAGLLLIMGSASAPHDTPGAFTLRQAQVTYTVANLAPDAAATRAASSTKTVNLPHVWDDESPRWGGLAVYDLAWPDDLATDQALSLYLPRLGARFEVLLNGQPIASQAMDTLGYADTSVQPWLVHLPQALVRAGAPNRLSIRVKGQALRKSGLSPPLLGARAPLEARFARVHWWQVQTTWMVAACAAVLGLLTGLMWLAGQERVFGLMALASLCWAGRLALTPMVAPGIPFELWFLLHKLSFTWYCGLLYLFLAELFGFAQPRMTRTVQALMLAAPVFLLVTTLAENYTLYRLWMGAVVGLSVVALLLMFHKARWGREVQQRLVMVVGVVILITGLRDFATVQLGLPADGDMRWMTPGSLVFLLVLGWVLMRRTVDQSEQREVQNRVLLDTVAAREASLQVAFDVIRAAERQQFASEERRRITRDMHDGLGSQLVQTLHVVRASDTLPSARVEGMLVLALEELRMTLDAMEPMDGDLPTILGTLRQRIGPALEAAGVELIWQVDDVPPVWFGPPGLASRGVMHLFRLLQEVFANVIKHARASRVVVRTWQIGDQAALSVVDNGVGIGVGIGAGSRLGGRGIANIHLRAGEMGAAASLLDAQPGTELRLVFAAVPQPDATPPRPLFVPMPRPRNPETAAATAGLEPA